MADWAVACPEFVRVHSVRVLGSQVRLQADCARAVPYLGQGVFARFLRAYRIRDRRTHHALWRLQRRRPRSASWNSSGGIACMHVRIAYLAGVERGAQETG